MTYIKVNASYFEPEVAGHRIGCEVRGTEEPVSITGTMDQDFMVLGTFCSSSSLLHHKTRFPRKGLLSFDILCS
jgi:hypothetical protein